MDDIAATASAVALTAAASAPANEAVENWIATGRAKVDEALEPVTRIAATTPGFGHMLVVMRDAFSAAAHSLLSHVAHEEHPGVIAEAVKLAEKPVEDLAGGDVTSAVVDGVNGVGVLAADVAQGAVGLVTDEDIESVKAAAGDGMTAAATSILTGTVGDAPSAGGDPLGSASGSSEGSPAASTTSADETASDPMSPAAPLPSEGSVAGEAGSQTPASGQPSSTEGAAGGDGSAA